MENKRISVKYIQNKNADGNDIDGVIVNIFDKNILIGVTEKHGGDAEIGLDKKWLKNLLMLLIQQ